MAWLPLSSFLNKLKNDLASDFVCVFVVAATFLLGVKQSERMKIQA